MCLIPPNRSKRLPVRAPGVIVKSRTDGREVCRTESEVALPVGVAQTQRPTQRELLSYHEKNENRKDFYERSKRCDCNVLSPLHLSPENVRHLCPHEKFPAQSSLNAKCKSNRIADDLPEDCHPRINCRRVIEWIQQRPECTVKS